MSPMSHWLSKGAGFPIQGSEGSKPLCGSKVDSTFHPPEANQMSTNTSWGLSEK